LQQCEWLFVLAYAPKHLPQSPKRPIITGSPEDLLLKNSFQSMFQHKGIVFDNKTGLFHVNHKQHSTLAVKGHGFEYVLLRRAFSRKGIRLLKASSEDDTWLEVSNDCEKPFAFYWDGECISQGASVEKIVAKVIAMKPLIADRQKCSLNHFKLSVGQNIYKHRKFPLRRIFY
jgi:hypothetical protein